MTFGGRIQCTGDTKKSLARLRALESFKSAPSKLAPGDEPSVEALPREVDSESEDFVEVTYRALSAAVLGDRPIDFTKEAVLKKGVPLLKGQTVFKDHNTSVDNWVGQVIETAWDSKTPGLPPGINAKLRLDMIKDPMAVRGVLQGTLHSASVTVSFQWTPSHPKLMEENRFFQYLGEEVEGEMVRVIVTKIEKFWEISLVWQGADEFAKQIDENGDPLNIYDRSDSMSAELKSQIGKVATDYLNQEEPMSLKIKEAFKKMFGLELSDDNFEEAVKNYVEEQKKSALLKDRESYQKQAEEFEMKLSDSSKKIEELEGEVKKLIPQAELGAAHLKSVRDEAVRLYKVSKGDEAKEVILKTLENANLEIAMAWKEEFEKDVEEKFPAKCQKCQSTEISRQSSKAEDETKSNVVPIHTINDIHANKLRSLHD